MDSGGGVTTAGDVSTSELPLFHPIATGPFPEAICWEVMAGNVPDVGASDMRVAVASQR